MSLRREASLRIRVCANQQEKALSKLEAIEAAVVQLSEEELTALLSDKLKETAGSAVAATVPTRNRG